MIKPNKKQTAWSDLDTYIFQIPGSMDISE